MTDKRVTPIIKAEQIIHSLAGGNYLLEVLVWVLPCMVMATILYFSVKKTLNSNSCKPKSKNPQTV